MRAFTLSFIAIFFLLLSISAFSQKAYLPHGRSDVAGGITVFDINKNAVATEIPIDNVNASWITISPDGSKAYAEFSYTYNPSVAFILVVDTKTDKIIDTISMGSGAFQISSDGTKLYGVTSSSPNVNAVFVMNLLTKQVESTIPLPVSTGLYNYVGDIVLSRDENKLYAAESNTIQIIDLKKLSVYKTINLADDKYAKADITALTLSPDGFKLYASDQSGQKVLAINTFDDTISASIPCGSRETFYEPSNLIVSPDGSRIYTNNYYSLSIGVIDAVNNKLLDTFTVTNSNIDNIFLSPDGSKLYASDRYTKVDDMFIFNTANDSMLSKVRINSAPDLYGDFVSASLPDSAESGFVATSSNVPGINNQFFTQFRNANGQLYGELTSNNDLGSISWGASVNAQSSLQTAFGWFGGTQKQDGAYMNRNLFITPTNQPTSATTVRIYCTNSELNTFIDSFNHRYNTSLTEKDIRIVKYDGINVDLDRTNNVDNEAVYTSIAPSKIGYYGFTNTYRYIEFPVSSFSEFYITLAVPNGVLPVSLTKFTAENKGKDVQLNWQTGIGQNISLFDVEKSADGFAFKKMISVLSNNSETTQNYSALDNSPVYPKTFYRLRIVEKDGSYSYSNVIGVNFSSDKSITIYPNPASKMLTIQLNSVIQKGNQIRIMDASGRLVKIVSIANDNAMSVTVDISRLAKGLYTIVIGDTHKTFIKGE